MRIGINELVRLVEENDHVIAILPTGYGKSSFLLENRHLFDKLRRVIHIFPLQSIVFQLYSKLKNKGYDAGYQMSLEIPEGDKRPFLSKSYMVTTIDSFCLDFYGVPVHEIYRAKWHSDLAFLMARYANVILDEFHLVTSVDVEEVEEEFVKIVEISRDILENVKLKRIILSGTLSPSLINNIAPNYIKLVLAPENHPYVKSLRGNIKLIWSEKEDDFIKEFSSYTEQVKTYIVKINEDNDIINILNYYKNKRVLIVLNHANRVEILGTKYKIPFIHGQFGSESKRKILDKIESFDCLLSTQLIEAGVDVDFDVLITDIAPAYSLIQRAGRVARYRVKASEIIIIVRNNKEEQVKGVYDSELTNITLQTLLNNRKGETKIGNYIADEIEINWRLPEENKLDYLKLVLSLDSIVAQKISKYNYKIRESLNLLKNLTLEPSRIISKIDEEFGGSFVRSSSIIPVALGNNEISKISLEKLFKKIENKDEIIFKYKKITNQGIFDNQIKFRFNKKIIRNKPFYFLRSVINKIRKQENEKYENLSGYLRILPIGFDVDECKIEEIRGERFYYLSAL